MEFSTVLLIVLAAVAALSIVLYQYFYRIPKKGSLRILLATLRFLTLFCGLLLLINPKFVHRDYFLEKANLIVLVDDSSSIQEAQSESSISETTQHLLGNPSLQEHFSVQAYAFGKDIRPLDSLRFNQRNTDISKALSTVDEIFVNGTNAVVLLTDGNQTLGRDYEYLNLGSNLSVNPVVVGDTTSYEDISIGLINTNTYAFLKNRFPVEATVLYNGQQSVSKNVTITLDGKVVHRERVELDQTKNSQTLHTLVEAQSVGMKTIRIDVETLVNERSTANNRKETAIEVIDERTRVVIVSDMLHPDMGALKKAIESNEQRTVSIYPPTVSNRILEEADLLILYQPNRKFNAIYDHISKSGVGTFTITGTKTDWNFLNRVQQSFQKENNNQSEDILPVRNATFQTFGLDDFNVNGFPPLEGYLGNVQLNKSVEVILYQQIRGVDLGSPLFAVLSEGNQREAVLFGENLWKWRAQTFRNDQSFQNFDAFMGKLMVYLGSTGQRNRLELDYDLVFDNASLAQIRASYFDESYQFDPSASISIQVQGKDNGFSRESPMLLKGNFFEVDLGDLEAGEYQFTVTVKDANLKQSGSFKILDFNPEDQFTSSNFGKLGRLAEKTNGNLYFSNNTEAMLEQLTTSQQYVPTQKSKENIVSLIDFRILLGLIVLTLALEWFIRKYNGLI
ncbi:VWA domain-containing protein [Flagellimonas sp. SN16]|uniref:VWA domain-containing protein n=1 Tax=Flagellimonas sp. SN16 TaxID=3415142 RepID=UPI003C639716